MQSLNKAYLLIGGNVGNVFEHFQRAIDLLNKYCGKVVKQSAVYETAPWGEINQPAFLNQALLLETPMQAKELMTALLSIEEQMGRKRLMKYGPRIIDIDILLFNAEVHKTVALQVPHPQLQFRRFALIPLADIAGDMIHPVLNKTISELLMECSDELEVEKVHDR
jgi:2-amino-4-hydroxy-6-hydroxymethyldihydropteridine diphosphokinase